MIAFRDRLAREYGLDLIVHTNTQGVADNVTPFTYGSKKYTDIMKTQALLTALEKHGFDAAFGGARRDEERSRAKERVLLDSRPATIDGIPRAQRPELWNLYNGNINRGEEVRIFPLSNWTEIGHLAIHPGGEHRDRSALSRRRAARGRTGRDADHGG